MFLRCFLNNCEVLSFAPIITGLVLFTFHISYIFILRSKYFKTFRSLSLITFLSTEIVISINTHILWIIIFC
jgi:hypothetical protein